MKRRTLQIMRVLFVALFSGTVSVTVVETSSAQPADIVVKISRARIPLTIDTTLYRLDVVDYRVDGGLMHIFDRKNEGSYIAYGDGSNIPEVSRETLATSDAVIDVHAMFFTYSEIDSARKTYSEWIMPSNHSGGPGMFITGPLDVKKTHLYEVFAQLVDYIEELYRHKGPNWREVRGMRK